jgi:DNA-directed RNA polymerase specialized sigma24 family protein
MEVCYMAEIKNPEGYFTRIVQNSYKDEYRSNDNFYNHISSVGDEHEVQLECAKQEAAKEPDADFVERELCDTSVENWLLLMENERLHTALCNLPTADVKFLLALANYRFNKTDFAKDRGISQQAVSKRFHRLRKKIISFTEKGL